jgi:hypothetical protein
MFFGSPELDNNLSPKQNKKTQPLIHNLSPKIVQVAPTWNVNGAKLQNQVARRLLILGPILVAKMEPPGSPKRHLEALGSPSGTQTPPKWCPDWHLELGSVRFSLLSKVKCRGPCVAKVAPSGTPKRQLEAFATPSGTQRQPNWCPDCPGT